MTIKVFSSKKICFQILSSFLFAFMGAQIKYLSDYLDTEIIVFYRCLIGTIIIFLVIISKKKKKSFFKSHNLAIQILRSIFGLLAMYFGYTSLTLISLPQATSISFTKVFFVSILSIFFLNEKFNSKIFFFSIIGFFGVFLIVEPEQLNNYYGFWLSIFSALFVGLGIISISFLSQKNETLTILFYHSFFSLIFSAIIFYKFISIIDLENFLKLFFITITAILGQFFNTESYKNIETTKIIFFSYSRIIFSSLLGYFIFSNNLTFSFFVGSVIIIVSSLFLTKDK